MSKIKITEVNECFKKCCDALNNMKIRAALGGIVIVFAKLLKEVLPDYRRSWEPDNIPDESLDFMRAHENTITNLQNAIEEFMDLHAPVHVDFDEGKDEGN